MGAVLWLEESLFNPATKDNATKVVLVVAVVSGFAVEGVSEMFKEVGMRHLLDKDDIRFPWFDSGGKGPVVAGPIAGDDAQWISVEIGFRLSSLGGVLSETDKCGGFV